MRSGFQQVSPPVRTGSAPQIAVAAPNRYAADAAARMGAEGGNAVDAALAGALMVCVTEPGIVSLAGGAFVTVDPGDGRDPVTVDGYVEMPGRGLPPEAFGRGTRELYTEYGGGTHMTVGHGSAATPGVLPALEEAHRRFGSLPWSVVVQPAIEVARDGFALGTAADYYLDYTRDSLFGHDAATRAALHHHDGTPVRRGELLRIPDLADFLTRVAREGSAALIRGEVARALAEDMSAHGGLITPADLAGYAPVVRRATQVELATRDGARWRIATNPPPAIGGPVLAAMLLLLADPEADELDRAVGAVGAVRADIADLVRVFRAVLAHRAVELDVAADRAAAGQALLDGVLAGGQAWLGVAPSTAHVSTVDTAGAACAVTASCGYGSGITIPGTGVWLNNCLGEHELNRTGLHTLAPGVRLASNMAPTVGRRSDGTTIAVGSPGADRITTALAQVLTAVAGGGLDWPEAIARPRVHVSRTAEGAERLEYESDLDADLAVLEASGALPSASELPRRAHHPSSMYFGGVSVAVREPDGALSAAADPRRDGAIAVSPP